MDCPTIIVIIINNSQFLKTITEVKQEVLKGVYNPAVHLKSCNDDDDDDQKNQTAHTPAMGRFRLQTMMSWIKKQLILI